MWVAESPLSLPRTRKAFFLASTRGQLAFVKPGKLYTYVKNKWVANDTTRALADRITKFVQSPCGRYTLHAAENTPWLFFHENKQFCYLASVPFYGSHVGVEEHKMPNGEGVFVTNPFVSLRDSNIRIPAVIGMAIADTGHALVLSTPTQLLVWVQLPEEPRGIGKWIDLSGDGRIVNGVSRSYRDVEQMRISHGFQRPRQNFTLLETVAPDLPESTVISYQEIAVFDNPDEGPGICCLTALLPPCRPFNTLYLFNTVCKFRNGLSFSRSTVTLSIDEGRECGPCIWWSPCCRIAVIAVSLNLIVVTRNLKILGIVPIPKVFPEEEPVIANGTWSCHGRFFVMTSAAGNIGAISRFGTSMRHHVCHLSHFGEAPLFVCADYNDPELFYVYSKRKCKPLRINSDAAPNDLPNLLSLHFPQGSIYAVFPEVCRVLESINPQDLKTLAELLYYTELFRLFFYFSPLRYMLLEIFDRACSYLFENEDYLRCYFLMRCVFRVTESKVSVYDRLSDLLSNYSNCPLMGKIASFEGDKGDYLVSNVKLPSNISFEGDSVVMQKPPPMNDVDLGELIQIVNSSLYGTPKCDMQLDLRPLVRILIWCGLFDNAALLAKEQIYEITPVELLEEYFDYDHPLYLVLAALHSAIGLQPEEEENMRRQTLSFVIQKIQQRIIESGTSRKPLSEFEALEDEFKVYVFNDTKEANDTAVWFGIGFAACGYILKLYFDHKPCPLEDEINELIGLLWYVRIRSEFILHPRRINDNTLRLLGFPEMLSAEAVEERIKSVDERQFTPALYSHYMNGTRLSKEDPDYPAFVKSLKKSIRPSELSRLCARCDQLAEEFSKLPKSTLITSTVLSHIAPWLRCAINRGLCGYDCGDNLPDDLFDFEGLFVEKPPPKLEQENFDNFDEDDLSEPTSEHVTKNETPKTEVQEDETESYSDTETFRPTKQKHVRKRPHIRRKPLLLGPSQRIPDFFPTPPPPKYDFQPMQDFPIYPEEYYEEPAPVYQPEDPSYIIDMRDHTEIPRFPTIWDFDPNAANSKPKDPEPVKEPDEDKPTKNVEIIVNKAEPSRHRRRRCRKMIPPPIIGDTKFIEINREQPPPPIYVLPERDESSDLSDFDFKVPTVHVRGGNPFEIDEALHQRVNKVLDETRRRQRDSNAPDPIFYEERSYKHRTKRRRRIPSSDSGSDTDESNDRTYEYKYTRSYKRTRKVKKSRDRADDGVGRDKSQRPQDFQETFKDETKKAPDFYPPVVSFRPSAVIDVRQIPSEQFGRGAPVADQPVKLREVANPR